MSKDVLYDRIEVLEAQLEAISKQSAEGQTSAHCTGQPSSKGGDLTDVMGLLMSEDSFPRSSIGRDMDWQFLETFKIHPEASILNHDGEQDFILDTPRHDELAPVPSHADGLGFLRTYFETFHNRMPFLDRAEIYQLHEERHQLASSTPRQQWKSFIIFVIYAIGATTQMSPSSTSDAPSNYFRTALQLKPPITKLRSLESIEAMMLLIMYNLRSPTSSNIWYMIGLAMRATIDLGLHREVNYLMLKCDDAQRMRRLFWSVYLMDRSISRLLGRPFNIAEHDINVALPDNNDISFQMFSDPQSAFKGYTQCEPTVGAFIPSIHLVRLKSQIQNKIYRADKEARLLFQEIFPLLAALEEYKASMKFQLPPIDNDWIHMHWNNGICMLLKPFLSLLHPDHELIHTCLKAAGNMCRFLKGLHQKGYIGFGYILINILLNAGLTMWSVEQSSCLCPRKSLLTPAFSSCLLRSPKHYSTTVADDLCACSSVLFAVTERMNHLKKYRDTWKATVAKVMKHLEHSLNHSQLVGQGSFTMPNLEDDCMVSGVSNLAAPDDTGSLFQFHFDQSLSHVSNLFDPSTQLPLQMQLSGGIPAVDDTQLDLQCIFNDPQDCHCEVHSNLAQLQPFGLRENQPCDWILSETSWSERELDFRMIDELFGNIRAGG